MRIAKGKLMIKQLLIATNNPGKLREIRLLLEDLDVELVIPHMLGLDLEVLEDGQTYAENAERKARAVAQASGLLTVADDSGLEVEALNGAPGLFSARFSPLPHPSDADRRAYLLEKLKGHPRPWRAAFHCTVALVDPLLSGMPQAIQFAEGVCQGEVIPEERGQDGFGYDPVFLIPSLGKTMAELGIQEKNRLSHRARAILAAKPLIEAKIT